VHQSNSRNSLKMSAQIDVYSAYLIIVLLSPIDGQASARQQPQPMGPAKARRNAGKRAARRSTQSSSTRLRRYNIASRPPLLNIIKMTKRQKSTARSRSMAVRMLTANTRSPCDFAMKMVKLITLISKKPGNEILQRQS
jgi:hypothetical protein